MDEQQKEQTKRCPKCGEEILAVAIKCKHCGSNLSMVEAGASASRAVRKYGKRAAMVVTGVVVLFAVGLLEVKPRVFRYLAYREVLGGIEEQRVACAKAVVEPFEIWVPSFLGKPGYYRSAKLDQEQLKACLAVAAEAEKVAGDAYAGSSIPEGSRDVEPPKALEWRSKQSLRDARIQGVILVGNIWYSRKDRQGSSPPSEELAKAMSPMVQRQREDLSVMLEGYVQTAGRRLFPGKGNDSKEE